MNGFKPCCEDADIRVVHVGQAQRGVVCLAQCAACRSYEAVAICLGYAFDPAYTPLVKAWNRQIDERREITRLLDESNKALDKLPWRT